ncbi:hypothetical protein [Halalkalibaculum sp. DA384]|uniref:hypothetical protein n=1 Tax=Halalkalibaculum sp. DA384 TaxID=3373606 RepID=UPI003754483C
MSGIIKFKYAKIYLISVILVLISCSLEHKGDLEGKPNVILIMTDDQGYGDIGAHGNPYLKPHTWINCTGKASDLQIFMWIQAVHPRVLQF